MCSQYYKYVIYSINAILITSLITIIGNCINNKLINKGGSNNYGY